MAISFRGGMGVKKAPGGGGLVALGGPGGGLFAGEDDGWGAGCAVCAVDAVGGGEGGPPVAGASEAFDPVSVSVFVGLGGVLWLLGGGHGVILRRRLSAISLASFWFHFFLSYFCWSWSWAPWMHFWQWQWCLYRVYHVPCWMGRWRMAVWLGATSSPRWLRVRWSRLPAFQSYW